METPEPRVVTTLREFKAQLLLREASQMQEMARRWVGVEQAVEAQIMALAEQVHAMKNEGVQPSAAMIYRLQRYRILLAQTQAEFQRYAEWAAAEIARQQVQIGAMAIDHSVRAIEATYWPATGVFFDRLPVEAVEAMIGLAGNGAPIGDLLMLRMVRDEAGNPLPGVWERLTQILIDSTALGRNPRETARMMQDALASGLQKALVIARSEQLRVYRQIAWDQYAASGVVDGQRRLAAHDSRVCPACLADEGTVYYGPIPDHPNGRCTGVPNVIGMPQTQWTMGENWLRMQDQMTQIQILGPGRYSGWRDGQFDFSALVSTTFSREWGGGLTPTPLRDL